MLKRFALRQAQRDNHDDFRCDWSRHSHSFWCTRWDILKDIPKSKFGTPKSKFGTPRSKFGLPRRKFGVPKKLFGMPRRKFG